MESLILLAILPALAYLLKVSKWLTIRLEAYESLKAFDKRILRDMQIEWDLKQAEKEAQYQEWLKERYADKVKLGTRVESVYCSEYEWMAKDEERTARRNGEMIYQRGR